MVSSNREGTEWNVDRVWYLVTRRVQNGTWTGYGNREAMEWNADRPGLADETVFEHFLHVPDVRHTRQEDKHCPSEEITMTITGRRGGGGGGGI